MDKVEEVTLNNETVSRTKLVEEQVQAEKVKDVEIVEVSKDNFKKKIVG